MIAFIQLFSSMIIIYTVIEASLVQKVLPEQEER